jgi:TonB family protein
VVRSPRRGSFIVSSRSTQIAVSALIEGIVILEATIDRSGAVQDARVLRSHGVLDRAAVQAVEQARLRLEGATTNCSTTQPCRRLRSTRRGRPCHPSRATGRRRRPDNCQRV